MISNILKYIALAIMLAILISLLQSCSTEKKLQRAINKHGQKESAAYIVSHYPEYFLQTKDSVKATLAIPKIDIDTSFTLEQLHDTVTIVKDNVIVKEIYLKGKIQTIIKNKVDTVVKYIQCPEKPQPNKAITDAIKESKQVPAWVKWFPLSLIAFFIILFMLKRKSDTNEKPKVNN